MSAKPIIEDGVKIATQASTEPSESELQFIKQMGIQYVTMWTDGSHANYDYFVSRREIGGHHTESKYYDVG